MKVALVYSFQDSNWFSCTVILKNLLKSYVEYYGEDNILHINYNDGRYTSSSDLMKLINEPVEKIIFLNHKPTPINFLQKLQVLEGNLLSTNREYIIHIYGDFPLYAQEWRVVFELLKEHQVKLICASEAQKKLIQNFVIQENIVFKCPFPVCQKEFFFDEKLRKSTREKYKIGEDDYVLIYTGRLSYQKRITSMVEAFYQGLESGNLPQHSKLILVGGFDNLGILYLGLAKIQGEYFREVDRVIESNRKYSKNVILINEVEHSELNALYCAADLYYSLGTYHDEDYGMSVAEAICTGLPALLTKWAGYRSFQLPNHPETCELVPVTLSAKLPEIEMEQVGDSFNRIRKIKSSREERSDWAREIFSVESCSLKIKEIHQLQVEAFQDRSPLFKRLTNENIYSNVTMFKKEREAIYNDLYREVYHVYID